MNDLTVILERNICFMKDLAVISERNIYFMNNLTIIRFMIDCMVRQ